MRNDFRVLWWQTWKGDGPWSDAATRKYREGGYEGVFYFVARPVRQADLKFLSELPGLRYVEVDGPVADDTAAFGLANLDEAIIMTRCSLPIPEIAATRIRRLAINDRPGKERLSALGKLEDLQVWGWTGQDLSFLAKCKSLEKLKIEATRQLFSLSGLEACKNLVEIELWDARVGSLAPLRVLRRLRRLWLIGDHRAKENAVLDLSDIEHLPRLEQLTITFQGVGALKSLEPLTRMRHLREVRLRGTFVLGGDLSPLSRLRPGTIVVGPND